MAASLGRLFEKQLKDMTFEQRQRFFVRFMQRLANGEKVLVGKGANRKERAKLP